MRVLTLGSVGRLSRWRSHLASQFGPSGAWSRVMSVFSSGSDGQAATRSLYTHRSKIQLNK